MNEAWSVWGAAAGAWTVAAGVTWVMLVVSRRLRLLDLPNARSAHASPMPTGGGIGLIAGCWAGWAWLLARGNADALDGHDDWLLATLAGTVVLLPMIWDDLVRPLRVAEKMGLIMAAASVWMAIHGIPEQLSEGPLLSGSALSGALVVLWFVSTCNASNFMDGIDGIVGVHVVSVACATAASLWLLGGPWEVAMVLAAAGFGFLLLNRPPARVFMGDVGSNSAGFLLAAMGILAARSGLPIWLYFLYNWVFFFDTGYTLVRRAANRENVLQAHQKHLYQRLVRVGWSHQQVDLWVLMVNAILGGGGVLYLTASVAVGVGLLCTGAILLVGAAVYLERRDDCFV